MAQSTAFGLFPPSIWLQIFQNVIMKDMVRMECLNSSCRDLLQSYVAPKRLRRRLQISYDHSKLEKTFESCERLAVCGISIKTENLESAVEGIWNRMPIAEELVVFWSSEETSILDRILDAVRKAFIGKPQGITKIALQGNVTKCKNTGSFLKTFQESLKELQVDCGKVVKDVGLRGFWEGVSMLKKLKLLHYYPQRDSDTTMEAIRVALEGKPIEVLTLKALGLDAHGMSRLLLSFSAPLKCLDIAMVFNCRLTTLLPLLMSSQPENNVFRHVEALVGHVDSRAFEAILDACPSLQVLCALPEDKVPIGNFAAKFLLKHRDDPNPKELSLYLYFGSANQIRDMVESVRNATGLGKLDEARQIVNKSDPDCPTDLEQHLAVFKFRFNSATIFIYIKEQIWAWA